MKLTQPGKLKWAGAIISLLGGPSNMVAGALDIVMGAKKIEDVDSNMLEKVASAFQVGAGVSGLVTGGATLAALIGVGGATAMGVTAGVGGVFMSAFSLIGMGIGIAVQEKKMEESVKDTAKDFDQWNELGVAEDNYLDKLNYVQNARYHYAEIHGTKKYNELFPEDKPMWEARPEQYKDFTDHMKRHSSIDEDWFELWDEEHNVDVDPKDDSDEKEHNGVPILGTSGNHGDPGSFDDFKEDIDRVDVGSIELKDDGWVEFKKDGVLQTVKARMGNRWNDPEDAKKIAEYLIDIHKITHPDGEKDEEIIKEMNKLLGESDKYNDIDELRRRFDKDFVALMGKDDEKPGRFADFRTDINNVDVTSIELDPENSNVVTFVKNNKKWRLDKDDHGNLGNQDSDDIFTLLHDLHDLIRPDGKKIDEEVAKEVTKLHDENDEYNDFDRMREHILEKFSDKYEDQPENFGTTKDKDGDIEDNNIGKPADFIEDIDKVEMNSIKVSEDGRQVTFVKDGIEQRVSDTNEINTKILKYLKGLHQLIDGKKERGELMDQVFGYTDHYNSLEKIQELIDPDEPAAMNDKVENPITPGDNFGTFKDFKDQIEKVDMGSLRRKDNEIYFKKGDKYWKLSDDDEGEKGKVFIYLNDLYNIINYSDGPVGGKALMAAVNEIFKRTDEYNGVGKLTKYLRALGLVDVVPQEYGIDFYENNKADLEFMRKMWDDWAHKDDIISYDYEKQATNDKDVNDLTKYERYDEDEYNAREWKEFDRAMEVFKFLNENKKFLRFLDSMSGDDPDGKISWDDVIAWAERLDLRW